MERSVRDLSEYRYECCVECLEDATSAFENGRYRNCLGRAYYSIFNGIRAVNALDGFDSSKHSGVISYFNYHYVKTGIFDKKLSKIIKRAYESREDADYLNFYIASKEEAKNQIERAEAFKEEIRKYLASKGVLEEDKK